MLRLSKFLSLELDVYRQIPPETLKKYPEDAPLSFGQCRLAIVGQELNGSIILTHDAFYRGHRHIVLCHFDLHTRNLSHLYDEQTDSLHVVGATLDHEQSLLAYTAISRESRRDVSRTSDTGDVFESHVVELDKPRDERVSLLLHKKTTRRQMVQVIGKSPAKRNGVFMIYVLVAIECVSLRIYNVGMKRSSKTKILGIHSLPSPDTVLIKEGLLLWFGYNVQFHSLTVLLKASTRSPSPAPDNEKKMSSVQVMLRHYFFEGTGKRFNLAFEVALEVKRVNMSSLVNLRPTDPRKPLFPPGACADRREATDYTSSFLAGPAQGDGSIYSSARPRSPGSSPTPRLSSLGPSQSLPVMPRPRAGPGAARSSPRSGLSGVSADARPYFRLVDVGKGVYCLCQQHPFVGGTTGMSPVICVSIYVLHCGARLDIDVNLPNIRISELATTRVFFGSIGSLLLIYVPGAYLQFIDCISGQNMEPSPNLILGSELATNLPRRTACATSPALITPLYAESHSGARSDLRDHYFIDNDDGIVYEYTLDRNALLRVFDSSNPETHVQALHLAIVHMHDAELVHRVMENLCAHQPHVLTPELLHEYLLGVPYQTIKDKNMEFHLLDLLPISSIETFANSRSRPPVKYEKTPVAITNANRRVLQTKRLARFMVGYSKVHIRSDAGKNSGQGDSSGFGRLIRIFGWGDDASPLEPSASSLHDSGGHKVDSEDRWQFVEALYDYMVSHYPRENKSKCMAWAKDFRREQIHACQVLFDYLKGISASSSYARFQTMENFYFALEELRVPPPKDFNEAFTELSIWHLPRSVFLQYVERGVFRITEPIVHQLFGELSCSPEDNAFKFALLTQLPHKGFIRCLRRYPENYRFLVDYFLSVMPMHFSHPQEVKTELLHKTHSSTFIPMDIFFANLAATQGIDASPIPGRAVSMPGLASSAPVPLGSSPPARMKQRSHGHLHDVPSHISGSAGSPASPSYPKGARTHAFVVEQISQNLKSALGVDDLEY